MYKTNVLGLAASLALCIAPAMAQDYPANTTASPGVTSQNAVNPAPDATGPYLAAGLTDFYHPLVRERALKTRIRQAEADGELSPAQAATARLSLHRVVLEERDQVARHGRLRDWDRERLNDMMDHIVDRFQSLKS